ncbi:hypothetical protein RND81_03G048400 [Saponaria officinalis]|uniref:Uncharacterized protein n=1 Tax=Saponaria officinalis TaxID=3572 RepID=A0AAW1LYC9_SAPOF
MVFVSTISSIWEMRNEAIFRGKKPNPVSTLKKIEHGRRLALEKQNVRSIRSNQVKNMKMTSNGRDNDLDPHDLEPGSPSFIIGREGGSPMSIIKVDAAWIMDRSAACGWVLYEEGREFAWGAKKF